MVIHRRMIAEGESDGNGNYSIIQAGAIRSMAHRSAAVRALRPHAVDRE
jgi:hypothetical protein